jgi:hypothetical protein
MPTKAEWIIQRCAADLTSRSLQKGNRRGTLVVPDDSGSIIQRGTADLTSRSLQADATSASLQGTDLTNGSVQGAVCGLIAPSLRALSTNKTQTEVEYLLCLIAKTYGPKRGGNSHDSIRLRLSRVPTFVQSPTSGRGRAGQGYMSSVSNELHCQGTGSAAISHPCKKLCHTTASSRGNRDVSVSRRVCSIKHRERLPVRLAFRRPDACGIGNSSIRGLNPSGPSAIRATHRGGLGSNRTRLPTLWSIR